MATQTLTVALRALVDAYTGPIGKAIQSTDKLTAAGARVQKIGGQISSVGDSLTRRVTLPLLAVGGIATKMAADFDSAFTQMTTLAGVSAGEVDGLKESVLDLAGETGRAPQELADALLMIRSSGFEGAAALDVLEMSAKGAALSMGTTREVANAITNVLSGYGQANITAAQAMDVLAASVEQGKTEASEMAPQFGRLIPVAAELGVTFDELGGIMAFLSKPTGDAALSATQLSGVLAKMLEPGIEGANALRRIGMSADDLRASIREKGLHQTLIDLRTALEEGGMSLNDFSVDQQFLQGALLLTGSSAEDARQVIEAVGDSAGKTDEAFGKWAETMGAQNAQAFGEFQATMIRLGDVLLPIATDAIGFASKIVEAFAGLPDGAQKAIVFFGLVAAATGPLLSGLGRVTTAVGVMMRVWDQLFGAGLAQAAADAMNSIGTASNTATAGTVSLSNALGRFSLAIGVLAVVGQSIDAITGGIDRADLSKLENDLLDLGESGRVSGELASLAGDDFGRLKDAIEGIAAPSVVTQYKNVGEEISTLGGLLGETGHDLEEQRQLVDDLDKALANLARQDPERAAAALERLTEGMNAEQADRLIGLLDDYDSALAELDTASRVAEGATEDLGGAMGETAGATDEARTALVEYAESLKAQFDPLFGMVDALQGVRDAQGALAQAEMELAAARDEGDALKVMAAEQAVADARLNGARAAVDLESAATGLKQAMDNEGLSAQAAADQLVQLAVDAGFSREAALKMAESLGFAAGEADRLGGTDPDVAVTASGVGKAVGHLSRTRDAANSIPGRRDTHVAAQNAGRAVGDLLGVRNAVNSIDRHVLIQIRTTGAAVGAMLAGRQHGGPIEPWEVYRVGEAGEEWFMADRPGYMLSNPDVRKFKTALAGQGTSDPLADYRSRLGTDSTLNTSPMGPRGQRTWDFYHARDASGRWQPRARIFATGQDIALPKGIKEDKAGEWLRSHGLLGARMEDMRSFSRQMTAAMSHGSSGSSVTVNVSMAGAIVASTSDAERWVANAWQRAAENGRISIRGRKL